MRTFAAAAAVVAAGMTFAVAVVIAAEIQPDFELAGKVLFGSGACIAGSAADNFDVGIVQRGNRAAADTAANNDIDIFSSQQRCQSAVSGIAAFEEFFAGDEIVFGGEQRERRSVAEVLKNFVIFAGNGYNHFLSIPFLQIIIIDNITRKRRFASFQCLQ